MEKRKIVHLINYAGNGGSEKYIQTLGGDFLIYNIKGPLTNYFKSMQMEMRSAIDFKAAKKLAKFCKKHNIGVVHTHFAREQYIAVLSKLFGNTAKIIYTSHINLENNLVKKATNLLITRKTDAVIAVCNSVKTLLIKNGYPRNKIKVIYNGTESINIDLNVQRTNIVTLARLSEEKGLFFLCDIARKMPNHNFIIAGEGPLKDSLLNYATKNVSLVGHVNAEDVLKNAALYINSSTSEALSFGVLEAMSYKTPVVLTNVGGNVDIIKESGAGLLITYGDVEEAVKKINKVLANREVYAKKALKATEAVFSLENMKKQTYFIYGTSPRLKS